ncbi:reverse transcriptase domain-containing protein, partial [Klebsiella pneumoniae]|uniref:reverse transcriptase domain-containing protein n=1 Tax=Klebsiella pneumoniae TaxID=573 RepID=UPI003EBCCF59
EMKAKIGQRRGAKLKWENEEWWMVASLFADDTVLLAESEEELQRVVDEFCRVCERRKLKVNVSKSKVMVFERRRSEVVEFQRPYRVEVDVVGECKIEMNRVRMEEVTEF